MVEAEPEFDFQKKEKNFSDDSSRSLAGQHRGGFLTTSYEL